MEVDSGADSVSSTPRATNKLANDDNKSIVRLMCSFGGKIVPRPHDNQLRYVGGDTRIVAVHRTTTYNALIAKLSKLVNGIDFTVKYQLPNEDLDALITVSNDEDIDNMLDEFDRLTITTTTTAATITSNNNINNNNINNSSSGSSNNNRVVRLRLFLFPTSLSRETSEIDTNSRTSSIASLLDGSKKRENWFLDALNGGGAALERRRSEASSIVSEVPDYLFGLDNSDDTDKRVKSRTGLGDGVPGSDPGSPAFGSTSSASQLPTLPPVKTKLEGPNPGLNPGLSSGWGPGSNPGSPYPVHHQPQPGVQSIPVYYVPAGPGQGPGVVPQRNSHLQPVPVPVQVQVPVPGHFVQQYGPGPVQVPVGYSGPGPVYGAGPFRPVEGMDPFVMQMQGNMGPGLGPGLGQVQGSSGVSQPLFYAVNKPGMDANYPPGMILPVSGEEMGGYGQPGLDAPKGRTMQP
ncbi:uncharacterized protein LOC141592975 [Silene latifolia]|uniref:uncharacterized protein LOC141592975 n=1 Tax=Silene latifolia TaxID=37657 RepID=UPI003D76E681